MPKLNGAEVSVSIGGHRCLIVGDIEIVSDELENPGTLAGALIVEDRVNAKLLEKLEHVETLEVDGEPVDVLVTYNPLDASRIESVAVPVAKSAAPAPAPAPPDVKPPVDEVKSK